MEIGNLVHINIDKWDADGIYEEKFRLPLTIKHTLVVGRWEIEGDWGVDLRRWSYDQGRLLGAGITLNDIAWQWVFKTIYGFHEEDVFTKYGIVPKKVYEKGLQLSGSFTIRTSLFDEGYVPYFCINLLKDNQQVWRGRATPASIIIRLNTISDFLNQAQDMGLAIRREHSKAKVKIDPNTGKEIF